MQDEEYFAIKERAAAVLLRIPHVTGVGLGGRVRGGRPTGEIVIKVFVRRKKPAADVPPGEMIPASFEGIPIDVAEMGPTVSLAPVPGAVAPASMTSDDARTVPVRGGMDLFMEFKSGDIESGTLGCLLRDKEDASAIYGLTAHHVVVDEAGTNRLSRSRRVKQRSATTGLDPFAIVAGGGDDKTRDAAVIRLNAFQEWLPAIKDVGFVKGTHRVTVAEAATEAFQVRKRGITTKLTGGVVVAVGVEHIAFNQRTNFSMVIRPNPDPAHPPSQQVFFAFEGDSGSAVVNDDNEVVALLWARETNLEAQFINGVATPIHIVLERFKQVERLDLEVAVAVNATPTDALEVQRVIEPAGARRMSADEILARGDPGYRRPLTGGSQLLAEPMLGALQSTTLCCVVTEVTDPGTAYMLTSYSGVSANGTRPPTGDTDVGQPDNSGSCSRCCRNTVGEFSKGGPDDAMPTSAIVRLGDDQKWLAEILQIGLVGGIAEVSAIEVSAGIPHVRKYGAGTRLTGGLITAIGGVEGDLPTGVRPDAMLIRPNPNPLKPTDDICFSHFIDRGAAVVDSSNKVVGLLYDEVDIPDPGGRHVIHGVATPIRIVLDQLNALEGIDVTVATAAAVDDVRTASHRVITRHEALSPAVVAVRPSRPASVPAFAGDASAAARAFAQLQIELSQSAEGRLAIAMWNQHRGEIRHLIDHNRKVATVWHRSGGPALLQALLRAFQVPSANVPATLGGVPIAVCLDRVARVLCKYGSPGLQVDVAYLRPLLPPIGGLSFAELLTHFHRA